jgi:hypothetical protein
VRAVIGVGTLNNPSSADTIIVSVNTNATSTQYASLVVGTNNDERGNISFIVCGDGNGASNTRAVVVGGNGNTAS